MINVGEIDEESVPLPREKLFFNVGKEKEIIEMILDKILVLHEIRENENQNFSTKACFGAAVNNGCNMLCNFSEKLTGSGGRVIMFSSQQDEIGFAKIH